MPIVETSFSLNEDVRIRELKCPARIRSIRVDMQGVLYFVTYWWEGKLEETWLSGDELQSVKDN